jgi:replicative DNA helicase
MARSSAHSIVGDGCEAITFSRSLWPANIDEERQVLGMCIVDADAAREAVSLLMDEDFSLESHRRIFAAIRALIPEGPLDYICVSDWLARRRQLERVGGVAYITDLGTGVNLRRSMGRRAKNLRDYLIRRLLLGHSEKLAELALRLDIPPREVLNSARHSLDKVEKFDKQEISAMASPQVLP